MGLSHGEGRVGALPVTVLSASFLLIASVNPAIGCDPIAVALGRAPVASCPGLDANGDGNAGIGELARRVAAAEAGSSGTGSPRTPGVVTIDVGTASGTPGSQVSFDVTLDSGGLTVTGTQNDIAYDPLTRVAANLSGDPDCTVNPATGKDVFTGFLPNSCTPGVDCTGIRVLVLSLSNSDPIPDGVLYSCNVEISPAAIAGTYPLVISNADSAGGPPNFDPQPTTGNDGAVTVLTPLDHYKCYKAKDLKNPKFQSAAVALSDQFESEDAEVKKPFLVCNPVEKNGEGISNSVDHLACYKIKSPKLVSQPKVEIVNQLGTVQLQAKKAFLLCVPSSKQVLP